MKCGAIYIAESGDVVEEWKDRDTLVVRVAGRRCEVDLDTWDVSGKWCVDLPPNWLHTDEEGQTITARARELVSEYLRAIT